MVILTSIRVQNLLSVGILLALFSSPLMAEKKVKLNSKKSAEPLAIDVYRSPSCGCCGKWIEHLKANQIAVTEHQTEEMQSIKDKYGVTPELASCHTALINGYVVEGHVPVADIKKLIATKPKIAGITVPGMPVGTPGMEMGDKKDAYQVVSFDHQNPPQVFSDYGAK